MRVSSFRTKFSILDWKEFPGEKGCFVMAYGFDGCLESFGITSVEGWD